MKISEYSAGEVPAHERRLRYLKCLASPARLEVVEGLQLAGPSSVAELARRLGRAADSLYYHLRELEKAGVVEVAGRTPAPRGHGGRRGVIYRMCSNVVSAGDHHDADASERAALGDVASAVLRLTERNVQLSISGPQPMRPPAELADLPQVGRTKAWLTPAEVDELGALLGKVDDFLRARAEPGTTSNAPGAGHAERTLCALTVALTTVPSNAS